MKKSLRLFLLSALVLFAGQAFAEDIIWQEDWSGVTEFKTDPSTVNPNYTFGGTVLNDDGTFKSGTAIYNEKLAGGEAPELLVAKGGGSFSARVNLGGKSGEMVLAFKCNKKLTVTVEGATIGDVSNQGNDYSYPVSVAGGTSEITITFTQSQSANARLDNIKLYQGTAKKPAGLSWGKASTTLTIGQEVTLALSNDNNLPVTYTSSDETVATISSEGVITLIAAGKTTLTAEFAGNDEYEAQTISIDVTVKEESGETPVDPQPGDEVKTVTVAEALSIIDGLADNAKTTETYQVKGYVISVSEISTEHGNVTFVMADDKTATTGLTIYRAKGFNGANITDENLLAVGDEVVVKGLLQKYVKNEEVTPELANGGTIVSINGNTGSGTTTDVEKVANIAAFNALAEGTIAELTLNNAIVLYKNVNGQNIELFVRDASGAIDLYNMGIAAEAGHVLNGTIIGLRSANSGFSYAMKTAESTNASTVSVGAAQEVKPVEIGPDEVSAYVCDLVKINSATLSEDLKKCSADGAEVALYDRFKLNLVSGLDTTKEYDITGLVYDGGEKYGMELVVTAITLAGGGEIVVEPAKPVASIAALRQMENTNNIELTLTNAKVLFNDGNYIYVRENGATICFYQINGLKDVAKTNAIINGKIIVDYEVFRLMPEVKANKSTNLDGLTIEESEEVAEPVQTTLATVATGANVCDLVTLTAKLVREVTYKEDGVTPNTTKYYLEDGDTKLVVVNNGKNLSKLADAGVEMVVVTGIVNTASDAYQVKLTQNAVDANSAVNADVNGDNSVDVADISSILTVMAGDTSKVSMEQADVNRDNSVDVADISTVLSVMASK